MGFIDWKNNRIDQFDEIKEYAQTAEKMEEETVGSRKNRRLAAEFFGTTDFLNAEKNVVLKSVISRAKSLYDSYQRVIKNSTELYEIDMNQLFSDLMLYSVVDTFMQGRDIPNQKVAIASTRLLSAFNLDNKTKIEDHISFIQHNEKYQRYMNNVFELNNNYTPVFWIFIIYVSSIDENGNVNSLVSNFEEKNHFIACYENFLREFSYYINQLVPGKGCGVKNKTLIEEKISDLRNRNYSDIDINQYVSAIKNPLYYDEDIYAENIINNDDVDSSNNKVMSIQSRVRSIIRLIDNCSNGNEQVLKNYYEHMLSSL